MAESFPWASIGPVRVVLFALIGLAFGSFLTVVVHRLPRKESVVAPRSRCPSCGVDIQARDNIPVVSWLLLRGRCRNCGAKISPEYPLTEAATGLLFAAAALTIESLFAAALLAPFLGLMLALALIDLRWRVVPNRITYPALAVFLAAIAAGHLAGAGVDGLRGLAGLALYAGPLFVLALALPHGMGLGDVKLAALIGLVLGSLGLAYVAVAAFTGIVAGGLGATLAMAVMGYGRKQQIPFGPFLAAGAVVSAFSAPWIAGMYLSLLG
jgi:leader peptidase (prepilin peptidase) / N-methyltransferase